MSSTTVPGGGLFFSKNNRVPIRLVTIIKPNFGGSLYNSFNAAYKKQKGISHINVRKGISALLHDVNIKTQAQKIIKIVSLKILTNTFRVFTYFPVV